MCALLAAVLLLTPAAGLSLVLCVSPNGHVAIEDVDALCCNIKVLSPSSGHGSLAAAVFYQPGRCGNCTDLSLLAGTGYQASSPGTQSKLASKLLAHAALDSPSNAGLPTPAIDRLSTTEANGTGSFTNLLSIPLRC